MQIRRASGKSLETEWSQIIWLGLQANPAIAQRENQVSEMLIPWPLDPCLDSPRAGISPSLLS